MEDKLSNFREYLFRNELPPSEPDYREEIRASCPNLSLFLSVIFCLAIGWILSLYRIFIQSESVVTNRALTATIDLNSFQPPTYSNEVRGSPGPAGGSNKDGTGSIDPALLAKDAIDVIVRPPEFLAQVAPIDTVTSIRDLAPLTTLLPASYTLDKSLPAKPGGNGAYKGDGKGFGRGHGDGVGDGSGGGGNEVLPTGALILLKAVEPDYQRIRNAVPIDGDMIKIQLRVNAHGVPEDAIPLSGPAYLYPIVLRAALGWRFKPLPEYAHLAPHLVVIEFTYRLGPKAASSIKELSPVILK